MPELKIKCPKCKKITGTKMSMGLQSFCSTVLRDNRVNCENCGTMITWNKEDVLAISFC